MYDSGTPVFIFVMELPARDGQCVG